MLRQILKIIGKNLKLLIRSRSSALIFVLGPLMLILLVGFAFNSVGTRGADIGIYSEKYSDVTLSFVKEIADGPFRTLKFRSEQACVENIKKGTISACVIFPVDLNIKDTRVDEIMFYVDYSRINIVWQVLDRIKKQLARASDSFSLDLTNVLLVTLKDIDSETNMTYPIIADTKQQDDHLISRIRSGSDRMDDIDMSLDSDSFEFEEIMLELGSLKHKVGQMYNNLNGMYKKAKDLNEYGQSQALLCAATPEEEDDIRAEMDFSQVGEFKEDIDEAYEEALAKLNYSYRGIGVIEEDIGDLDVRLRDSDDLRYSIQQNLSDTVNIVSVNKQNMDVIKSRLDNIAALVLGIEVGDAENIVTPVSTNIKPVIPEKTNLMYLFPNLMTLVTLFMCILLAATVVVNEKRSTAYFRNFISPSSSFNFIIASYLTNFFLMAVQMGVIFFIADYYFKTQVSMSVQSVSVILFLLITLFTFIGMFVGYLLNSQDTVTIGAIVVSSVMLFLSDMIMPLESMPAYISNIAKYNPFIIGSDLLKKAVLFHKPVAEISGGLYTLAVYAVIAFLLVLLVQWLISKQKIGKYANRYFMRREKRKWRRLITFAEDLEQEIDEVPPHGKH